MNDFDVARPAVLVVGGGAVGIFLAALLGKRNVSTLVVERNLEPTPQGKMMAPSPRTMEFCRQLGIADQCHVLPPDWPMNMLWVTSLDGHEIARIESPPSRETGAPGTSDFSPEFQAHCPQPTWERVVEQHARSYPSVEVRRGVRFERFEEYDDRVVSVLRDLASDELFEVESDYLVSCEGVGAQVVKQLGIPVHEHTLDYSFNVEFLCADLSKEHDKGSGIRYTFIDETGMWATIVPVDGHERWRMTLYRLDRDGAAPDVEQQIVRAIGHEFPFTIADQGRWKRRAAIAASYGSGRVYLAGDAAHANPPNGGFGMNTGIADAANLAWKLQAVIEGWGGPDLLASYGAERRPIAQITLAEAVRNYFRLVHDMSYEDITANTEAGERRRHLVGEAQVAGSKQAWWPNGIHYGYGYPWSSIVVPDPSVYPNIELQDYQPSTNPGFRAPHVFLTEGLSTLDLFGPRHVLLRVGTDEGAGAGLIEAARAAGLPLDVQDVGGDAVEAVYDFPLVLVRPDGHIAWRGTEDPKDPLMVVNNIRGFVRSAPATGADVPSVAESAAR